MSVERVGFLLRIKNRFAVLALLNMAVPDQPFAKQHDLFLALRIGIGSPGDHRDLRGPVGCGQHRIKRCGDPQQQNPQE